MVTTGRSEFYRAKVVVVTACGDELNLVLAAEGGGQHQGVGRDNCGVGHFAAYLIPQDKKILRNRSASEHPNEEHDAAAGFLYEVHERMVGVKHLLSERPGT